MVHQRQNFGLADRPSNRQVQAGGAVNPGVRARTREPDQQRARLGGELERAPRRRRCPVARMRCDLSAQRLGRQPGIAHRGEYRRGVPACRSFTSRNMRPMRAACEQLAGALLRFTEAMRSCNSALRRYSAVMPKQRYKPLQGNRTRKTKRLTCLQRRRKKTN